VRRTDQVRIHGPWRCERPPHVRDGCIRHSHASRRRVSNLQPARAGRFAE
jgi:hypothetical protein